MSPAHAQRVTLLVQVFEQIARTRMAGVPVQNPALQVQAVDFLPGQTEGAEAALLTGVLITPWFMNLVRLPEHAHSPAASVLANGCKAQRRVGSGHFEFIGAWEDALGAFEACSLFSPMFEFADHAGALATATEVLRLLRTPLPGAAAAPVSPGRRGFLLGRPGLSARA